MQFKNSLAVLLAAVSLTPLMVPAANASSCYKKTVKTTYFYRNAPRKKVATRTRTVYKTSYVPMLHTVYKTSYVPMPVSNSRTVITRTTRSEFIPTTASLVAPVVVRPVAIAPATTIVRTAAIAPTTTTVVRSTEIAPVLSTAPEIIEPGTVVYKEHHHKVRVSTLDPVIWY